MFFSSAKAELPEMKSISYRGGMITFAIPKHWKEEYEPEGGGTFYEDAADSGTLRLNVLTFKAPEGKLPPDGYAYFSSQPLGKGERLLKSKNNDGIKISKRTALEEGTSINLYTWQIAHTAPPEKFYMASFTWTILTKQSDIPKYQKEIEMLTEEISKSVFHPDLGKF